MSLEPCGRSPTTEMVQDACSVTQTNRFLLLNTFLLLIATATTTTRVIPTYTHFLNTPPFLQFFSSSVTQNEQFSLLLKMINTFTQNEQFIMLLKMSDFFIEKKDVYVLKNKMKNVKTR